VNWYAYVGNNPVTWVDPEGLWGKEEHRRWTRQQACGAGFSHDETQLMAAADDEIDNVWTAGGQPHFGDHLAYARAAVHYGADLWAQGRQDEALRWFGYGAHAVQDSYAHGGISQGEHIVTSTGNKLTKGRAFPFEDPRHSRMLARASREHTGRYLRWIRKVLLAEDAG